MSRDFRISLRKVLLSSISAFVVMGAILMIYFVVTGSYEKFAGDMVGGGIHLVVRGGGIVPDGAGSYGAESDAGGDRHAGGDTMRQRDRMAALRALGLHP